MARLMTRAADKKRAQRPSFAFTTRKLQGVPDNTRTAEDQAKIDAFIATRGVTRAPELARRSP